MEDIRDFLWRTRTPLVGQLKWRTKRFYDQERPLVIAFYDVDWGLDIVRSESVRRVVAPLECMNDV